MQGDRKNTTVSIISAWILGAVSTFGDWLWATYLEDGAIVPAVVHGIAIFMVLALVLGWAAGSSRATLRLLLSLPFAGLLIAGAFYPLARVTGYLAALILSWFLMWIALATLQRWARESRESLQRSLIRAALAALASGFAFWTISGIWTHPQAEPNYGLRLLAWTWAFLPGFLALLTRLESSDSRG